MDPTLRPNRPARSAPRSAESRTQTRQNQSESPTSSRAPVSRPQPKPRLVGSRMPLIIGAVLLVLAMLAWYFLPALLSPIDSSRYQAVFLNNGQVYFGKLRQYHTASPQLDDVYYFQNAQNAEANPAAANTDQVLIKLGDEIHKPDNKLILNRDSILFVENLSDDSEVVKRIKNNQ